MKREEFLKWLESDTCFSCGWGSDFSWRYEYDYENMIIDYLDVDEDEVTLSFEEWYWGGIDYRKKTFTFDEFVEAYKNDSYRS